MNGENAGVVGGDFREEFLRKVRSGEDGASEGGAGKGAGRGVDWKVVAALILGGVVILGWVVFMILQSGGSTGSSTNNSIPSIAGEWSCDDGSRVVLGDDESVSWTNEIAVIDDKYVVENGVVFFGAVSATYGDERVTIKNANDKDVICERSTQ